MSKLTKRAIRSGRTSGPTLIVDEIRKVEHKGWPKKMFLFLSLGNQASLTSVSLKSL